MFNINIFRYEVAISVLKRAKCAIAFNIQDHIPPKEEIKVTIDVIKEVKIYNDSNDEQKRVIENDAEFAKFLIESYYHC